MIEINLLSKESHKKKIDIGEIFRKYKKWIVPGAKISGSVIVIISLIILIFPRLEARTMRRLEKRWKDIEKDYQEVVNLKKEQKRLQGILENITWITKDRIVWARRLNDISDNLPSEIQLTELLTKVEKSKDKPERAVLIMSGVVPVYPGERAIGDFIKGLSGAPDFMKDFPEIEPPSTETIIGGIKKFTLKCYIAAAETQSLEKETQKKK